VGEFVEEILEEIVKEIREGVSEIVEEIVEEVEKELREEVVEEVREEVVAGEAEKFVVKVREGVLKEILDKVRMEAVAKVRDEVVAEVWEEVREEVMEKVRKEIVEEVRARGRPTGRAPRGRREGRRWGAGRCDGGSRQRRRSLSVPRAAGWVRGGGDRACLCLHRGRWHPAADEIAACRGRRPRSDPVPLPGRRDSRARGRAQGRQRCPVLQIRWLVRHRNTRRGAFHDQCRRPVHLPPWVDCCMVLSFGRDVIEEAVGGNADRQQPSPRI